MIVDHLYTGKPFPSSAVLNLEKYFDFISSPTVFDELKIVNEVSEYQEILSIYREHLQESAAILTGDLSDPRNQGSGFYYQKDIKVYGGHFSLIFDVKKMISFLEKSDFPIVDFPLEELSANLNLNYIDPRKLAGIENNSPPIIIGKYSCITPSTFIIDGNHRAKKRMELGFKTIEGYFLKDEDFIWGLVHPNMLMTMSMHRNICNMFSYMLGDVKELKLSPLLNERY